MMKKLFYVLSMMYCCGSYSQQDAPVLWYRQPAVIWTDALPIGNGRLGGMVFGNYTREHIQLNEESVWAGSKINNNNPEAKPHMREIQQAIFKGEYKNALNLSDKYLVGTPPRIRSYEPLGDLFIQYHWKETPSSYKRSLNIQAGITTTEYTVGGNQITQEVYVSAPQDLMVISISAGKDFDADFFLSREFDAENENFGKKKKSYPTQRFYENQYGNREGLAYYAGQIIDTASAAQGPEGRHMKYAAAIKIISIDGKATDFISGTATGFHVAVKKIVLVLTGATNYNLQKLDMDSAINPLSLCKKIIANAGKYTAAALKQNHVKEHRSFFDRVHFSLGKDTNDHLATDERLARMKEGKTDNGLIALYYQFGRYLLMGSSRRPGRLPANLQGIWNGLYDAAWNSDFHTNINLQMNYWPAESGNLSETSEVLAGFMQQLVVPGTITAREMYGAKGWTIHHLTDPFGRTGVMDGVWGMTPTDGPWMTIPLYDHFEFTGDTAFLKKIAYPLMKGSVEFVLDFLVRSPEGYLVTNPSHSPENSFYVPGSDKKEKSQLTYAPTADQQTIHTLFNNFIHASRIFGTDTALRSKVIEAQKQLPPVKIAANGTIQEWIQDFEEVDPGHRHMAHLLGLYPFNLITPKEPAFFEAAKKTLERRLANGGGHTGWSKAWIVNLYARLLDPEKAVENLNDLLRKSTLTNLFDTHPPFQIDGNFGGSAAIAEMLLQSQNGEINLLPALPAQWPDGSMHGIRARGACTINMDWKNGKLQQATVVSDKGGAFIIRYKDKTKSVHIKPGTSVMLDGNLMVMNEQK